MRMNVTFAQAVLLRPTMYTMGGSFEEVIAFLTGYFSGAAQGGPHAPDVVQWSYFRAWLAEQLGWPRTNLFQEFRNRYETDEAARQEFLRLLTLFLEESR